MFFFLYLISILSIFSSTCLLSTENIHIKLFYFLSNFSHVSCTEASSKLKAFASRKNLNFQWRNHLNFKLELLQFAKVFFLFFFVHRNLVLMLIINIFTYLFLFLAWFEFLEKYSDNWFWFGLPGLYTFLVAYKDV